MQILMVSKFYYYLIDNFLLDSKFWIWITENAAPSLRALTDLEMRMSEEAGYSYVDRLTQLEEDLYAQGQYVKQGSPFYQMAQFKKPQEEARELGRKAARMLEATRFIKAQ